MNRWLFALAFIMMVPLSHAAQEAASTSPVGQQLQGFNLNGYANDGKKQWEINGDKADISDEKINVTNVDANFYGQQNANLKAKTGVIDKANGDIQLNKDVVITSDQGAQMTTDTLNWSRNKDLVSTPDPVRIDDQQGTITGKGLTAHPNLKKAELKQDVKAVINTKPQNSSNQVVTITCDGPMQMDQAKMYAVFHDNVVAVEVSTGRELHADTMEVYFDDKNKKIKKLICTGNVRVVQGDNASYADQMVYNGEDQTLVMTGRPKLIFDTGATKGSGMFKGLGQ